MTKPYFLCAIGDIHGELEQMRALHALILEMHETRYPGHELILVHVGDYVDRGPDSYGVIETLMKLEKTAHFRVINIRGNHEQQFMDSYDDLGEATDEMTTWCLWGGKETIRSYVDADKGLPYAPHFDWMEALPTIWKHEPSKTIFVHGGINPETYPNDTPNEHMWTRRGPFVDPAEWNNPALDGWRVVHGHTPTKDHEPEMAEPRCERINIDTGAVYGGQMTAVILTPNAEPEFVSVKSTSPSWKKID